MNPIEFKAFDLRKHLSFGFEATFTVENWWQNPGYCSDWETPEKLSQMRLLAETLAKKCDLLVEELKDTYGATSFQLKKTKDSEMIFQITPEPGSIEVNTPPAHYEELESVLRPLLESAELSQLVTYRSWWYGIKTGTGGGCHLNIAGKSKDENIWFLEPKMVLHYFSLFHQFPSLTYPFMGSDIGYQGNCMRMDEQGDASEKNVARFQELLNEAFSPNTNLKTLDDYYEFLKDVPLRDVKHSAPTFRKCRDPFYLVEDRAVEMPRTVEEFQLLCELRIFILEYCKEKVLLNQKPILKKFDSSLHEAHLSYETLFSEFLSFCKEIQYSKGESFKVFFERQFPKLMGGEKTPSTFYLREGKRQRRVVGVNEQHGSLVLSKKIDTSFKRIEIHSDHANYLWINGKIFKNQSKGILIDLKVPLSVDRPLLKLKSLNHECEAIESCVFNLKSFLYESVNENEFNMEESIVTPVDFNSVIIDLAYINLENDKEFL